MTCGFRSGNKTSLITRPLIASFVALAYCLGQPGSAVADSFASADAAYAAGNYVYVVNRLIPLALRGHAKSQAFLGFMFENGIGTPQVFDAAADLYHQAAIRGNPFAQAMLGLLYDKGHGVPQDFVQAYKWLNLASARAPKRERDFYLRLRNAVASKMSRDQITEGQRLAALFAVGRE
jgi:uncharacterized protein